MGIYTDDVHTFAENIYPEYLDDPTYQIYLSDAVKNFRSFGQALDSFLVEKGFDANEIDDIESKCKFIKEHFRQAGCPLPVHDPADWFTQQKRITNKSVPAFAFAFHMTLEEVDDFCKRISLTRGLDCHTIDGAVAYFCIKNHLPYSADLKIKLQLETDSNSKSNAASSPKSKLPNDHEILYTDTIINELDTISTVEELIAFLTEHKQQFVYNNATAYKKIQTLWDEIAAPGGLISKEKDLFSEEGYDLPDKITKSKYYTPVMGVTRKYSTDSALRFVFDFPEKKHNDKLKDNRSLTPDFLDSQLIHVLAVDCFPSRQSLDKVLRGNHVNDESIRKLLILLLFYRFWVKAGLKKGLASFFEADIDACERCLSEINDILSECHYPDLYLGNPYDWIFLWSFITESPLSSFRAFMSLLTKEDNFMSDTD